jgi:hypothetical protein
MRPFYLVLCLVIIALSGLQWRGEDGFLWTGAAFAQEDWKKDFEGICSGTQDAMSFSIDELKSLIGRCEKLKPVIETLDETQRKVYLKRLRMCMELLVFVLESKEKK